MGFESKEQFRDRLIQDLHKMKHEMFVDIALGSAVYAFSSAIKSKIYGAAGKLRYAFERELDFKTLVVPIYIKLIKEDNIPEYRALQEIFPDILPAFSPGPHKADFLRDLEDKLIKEVGTAFEDTPLVAHLINMNQIGWCADEATRGILTDTLNTLHQQYSKQAAKPRALTYMN